MLLGLHNGTFRFFCDNWNNYRIGNTDINVSREEAIQIAKENALDHTWTVGNLTVTNFNILDEKASAKLGKQKRENNTLYPHWDIQLPLDKICPGIVINIHVLLWVDTGDARATDL